MNTSSIVRTAVGMRVPQEKGTVYEAGGACAWKKRRLKSYWNSLKKKVLSEALWQSNCILFFSKKGVDRIIEPCDNGNNPLNRRQTRSAGGAIKTPAVSS